MTGERVLDTLLSAKRIVIKIGSALLRPILQNDARRARTLSSYRQARLRLAGPGSGRTAPASWKRSRPRRRLVNRC